jgi:tight adherence protein C
MITILLVVALTFTLSLAILLIAMRDHTSVDARLSELSAQAPTAAPKSSGIDSAARVASFLTPLRRMVGLGSDGDTARRLATAGYREPLVVDLYFTVKLLLPILLGLAATFVFYGPNLILGFMILAAIGFLAPDFWLTNAIARRREKIRLGMPDALDLLVICMEAGLGMDQALIRIGEELRLSHPELSDEFLLIRLEQRAGKPRIDAWKNMADRTGLEVVRSFVSMLMQTERFGTPLSRSLGYFADSLRVRRRQQAEEMAAKTTVKLVFPLVLFIFPSMFIVLLVPALISISRSFTSNFGH